MRSVENVWFTKAAKRAGWISALTTIAAFALLAWACSSAGPRIFAILYPLSALSVGAFAVGALNWRRWHDFSESMAACVYSVVACCKLLFLVLLPLGLILGTKGNLLMALLLFLFYLLIPLVIYAVLGFALLAGFACCGGAALYGLLVLMRRLSPAGNSESAGEIAKPRPMLG